MRRVFYWLLCACFITTKHKNDEGYLKSTSVIQKKAEVTGLLIKSRIQEQMKNTKYQTRDKQPDILNS